MKRFEIRVQCAWRGSFPLKGIHDARLKFILKLGDKAPHGHRERVPKWTDRMTLDLINDRVE
jgi:hypothetical protein